MSVSFLLRFNSQVFLYHTHFKHIKVNIFYICVKTKHKKLFTTIFKDKFILTDI